MKYSMKKVLHFTTSLLLVLFLAACSTELPESEEIEVTPATQEEQEPPALKQTVSTPVFSVESGEVSSGTTTEITCSTEGAVIYYTTDNSAPTEKSNKYINQITIEPPMTIKAIAVKDGMNNSSIAKAEYKTISLPNKLTVPTATMGFKTEPSQEKYRFTSLLETGYTSNAYIKNEIGAGTIVTLSSIEGANIYYTLDNAEPTKESEMYVQPLEITKKCVLKAKAIKNGYNDSDSISLNIDKPYKRELISNSGFTFNDILIHGNGLSGLFIIYETTEDFTGPNFSKQHFILKIDVGNTASGNGLKDGIILTFDTFSNNNYNETLRLNVNNNFYTSDYVKSEGTFTGNLWIKEIFKCDDPDILGAPQNIQLTSLNLGFFIWASLDGQAYLHVIKTLDFDEIAFLVIDDTRKIPKDWETKKIPATINELFDVSESLYKEYMADISTKLIGDTYWISIVKLTNSDDYYILPLTRNEFAIPLELDSLITDSYCRQIKK